MSNVASPTNKDGIMEGPLQINMTEIEVQWSFDAIQLDPKYCLYQWVMRRLCQSSEGALFNGQPVSPGTTGRPALTPSHHITVHSAVYGDIVQ